MFNIKYTIDLLTMLPVNYGEVNIKISRSYIFANLLIIILILFYKGLGVKFVKLYIKQREVLLVTTVSFKNIIFVVKDYINYH